MSLTRSSASMFLSGRTRMEISCGFSVSSRSTRRLISGSFALGAATIRRLEALSGQIRTCWPLAWAPPPGEAPPLLGGSPLGMEEGPLLTPGGSPVMREEEEEVDLDDPGEEGGAGWEFKISVSSAPNSSASECFKA